jgi:hypothetical protein
VFGALSAALIILLTTILVKRVSGNKTTENVEMGGLDPKIERKNRTGDHTCEDEVHYNDDEIVLSNVNPCYNE